MALSTSVGLAAEQPCFELYPNASGPEGAILLNKCTGQTWLLVSINTGSGNATGWQPIPIDMSADTPPSNSEAQDGKGDAAYAD